MFTNYSDVKIVARGSLSHGMNEMNKNEFFLKLVGLPQNRSESFGIDPNSVPAKFGGPSTPRTPTRDLVPFRIKKLTPEYPRMWNQMIRFLRHFDTVISVC